MVELSRTVRFSLPLDGDCAASPGRHNTFAGWPSMTRLGAYYELTITCRGEPDPRTGYLLNISRIDESVRTRGLPVLAEAVRDRSGVPLASLLCELTRRIEPDFECELASVQWHLTPFLSLTAEPSSMDHVLIRQQFTFAAAHRLHCPDLDDEANRRVFGKCNNPNGHGHNYRLEVAVASPVSSNVDLPLSDLERVVDETVIQRFDHTHLNLDCEEFAELNPSVENIARVCHTLLVEPLAAVGGALREVIVWETERTSCTYPAPSWSPATGH